MAFIWYFSKVTFIVGIFEVMSAHGLKCTPSEHESCIECCFFENVLDCYQERKQDGDFDKEKPLNILQNLLA